MSKNLNRREFCKKSLITSVGVTSACGLGEKALLAATVNSAAAPTRKGSATGLPMGKIGNVKVSRLIIGGNQFSSWPHSRDLKYLRELFVAYSTDEKIMETLQMAEENGINTIITASSGYLNKYWKERGGEIQWLAQVYPKEKDLTSNTCNFQIM